MDANGKVHNSTVFTTATTATDVPGSPKITNVVQVEDTVSISWAVPGNPNGIIVGYLIHMTPDGVEFQVGRNVTSTTLDYLFEPGKEYVFTVTAINADYRSAPSTSMSLKYSSNIVTETVENLRLVSTTPDGQTVRIAFDTSPEQIYKISYKSRNPFAVYEDIKLEGHQNKPGDLQIGGLTPNETYIVSVSVVRGNLTGRPSRIVVQTPGKSPPKPIITDAQITPDSGTSVKLSWKLPDDEKRQGVNWTYRIYYGTTAAELLEQSRRVNLTTMETTQTVKKLSSCQSYSFVVCIVGPMGTGAASNVFTARTKYAPGAPPKNLKATINADEMSMKVTWDASCPKVDGPIGYIIGITDVAKNMPYGYKIKKTTDASLSHTLKPGQVQWGTEYEITVKTDTADSISAGPIRVTSPSIPSPVALTNHFTKENEQFIYWSPAKLPKTLANVKFSYRLVASANSDLSDPVVNETLSGPPFKVEEDEFSPGKMYYVAVAMVDEHGYSSPLSSTVAIETTVPVSDLVVSKSGVSGVVIGVLIMLVALAGLLAFYVYRHRRLKRNFAAFASRYSPASGAAILNQSALDDDDDSPIIRGFSDDEPLVIT